MKENRSRVGIALVVSLVLSFLCGFAVYQSVGFVYAIADDVIMRDIASGAFTGTPDGHLIFVQYAFGWLISRLYLLNANVDWYGFILAGAVFMGLAVLLYRGLAAKKCLRWKLVYSSLMLGLFVTGLVFHAAQFEWTISAAVLGTAALYLYITMDRDCAKGQYLLESVWVWLLLVGTYSIRSSVFTMVLPGFGIAFLWKFVRKEQDRLRLAFREVILPVLVFGAVAVVLFIENTAYQDAGWKEFQKFQSARSDVYDYYGVPAAEQNPQLFEELGLDEHELRNLRHYALYLVEDMDAEMMDRLSEEAKRQNEEQLGLKIKVKNGLLLAFEQFTDLEYFPVSLPMLVCLLGVLVLAWKYQKGSLFPLFLFLGTEGALWFYLGFRGRLPERVAFSMHLVLLLGIGALLYRLWNRAENVSAAEDVLTQKKSGKRLLLLAGVLLSLAAAAFQWNGAVKANEEKLSKDRNYQLFKEGCKAEPEKLFFIETYMAEPVGGAEVTTKGNFAINNCLALGDWYTTSPLDQERFEALEIADVEETILTNPNAYLVVRDVEDPGFYATYFGDRYPEAELVCREVKVIEGRNYYLYQVQQ